MLRELRIKNFVLIDEQVIEFGEGFNVLTGETGAGKSIILQALAILLGAKPKGTVHRKEDEDAIVEAVFDLSKLPAEALSELPDILESKELLISRSLSPSNASGQPGKSRAFLNGRLATASMLEALADKLVNICGQNQHVRLLDAKFHLATLDAFADIEKDLLSYRELFSQYRESDVKLKSAKKQDEEHSFRVVELEELVEELEELSITPGLRAELESKVNRSGSAEKLLAISGKVNDLFSSGSEGLNVAMKALRAQINEIRKVDLEFSGEADRLFENAQGALAELEISFDRYFSKIDIDENELEGLRTRLSKIARVERKYRTDDAGLAEKFAAAKAQLQAFGSRPSLATLEKEYQAAKSLATKQAAMLSEKRRKAFDRLKKRVEAGLKDLNMAGASLSANFTAQELSIHGSELFEFLIATNAGEKPKQLKQVASGGELSRITLVLKEALQDKTGVNVLVFDEVDTGISGGVARAVGERLKSLASHSQVICITHLPQVASLADEHLLVEKEQGARAQTTLRTLKKAERVEEIARMLSGHKVTPASRQSAKELLETKAA